MSYIDIIKEKARSDRKTIVLPETNDKRTLIAASHIIEEGIANIIMVGNEEKIMDGATWLEIELDGKIVPAMVYVMTPGHSFGIPSDYYSNVIWQGYETAGFETQFLEDAIEHAYQLVQKQEREGCFYQQSLFHMGGYDGMK